MSSKRLPFSISRMIARSVVSSILNYFFFLNKLFLDFLVIFIKTVSILLIQENLLPYYYVDLFFQWVIIKS